MTSEFMWPTAPDWSGARTIVMLAIQAVMIPSYLLSLLLLWRRRRLYPIAGRGAPLLLQFNAAALVGSALSAVTHIAYDDGMPCAMLILMTFLPFPYAVVQIVRGYLLVFRLEIQNFLATLAWRKSKIQRLQQRQAEERAAQQPSSPSATEAGVAKVSARAAQQGSSDPSLEALSLPSLDPTTIPGHFCITNRRFMEPRWIMGAMAANSAGMVLSLALTAVYDRDVGWTNDWRESHGFPRDSPQNQFANGVFFEGPRCFIYSIKFLTFHLAMLMTFPFVTLMVWRLRANAQLMERQAQEQAEFDAIMRATAKTDPHATGAAATEAPSPLGGDAPSVGRAHAPASSSTELSELSAVKLEMASCLLFGGSSLSGYIYMIEVAYPWLNVVMALTLAGFWACTVPPALIASFRMAHKQRQMLLRARRDTKCGAKGARLTALVPHHRPLYRLKHVMADAHAYPVLLKFLQKEYSSENALFYLDARRFARECRAAERMLPGWRSSLDEDDDSNTHTTVGSPQASRLSAGTGLHSAEAAGGGGRPEGGSAAMMELGAFVEQRGPATPGTGVGAAQAPSNGQTYVVLEPLREDDADADADPDAQPDCCESGDAASCASQTRLVSVGNDARMFAIRVEQPGGSSGSDSSPLPPSPSPGTAASPSANASGSQPVSQPASPLQTRSIPVSPSLVASSPTSTWSLGLASPVESRVASVRAVGVELSPSSSPPPTSPQRSPPRSSGSFTVRTAAVTQARTELAWGGPLNLAAPSASPQRSSQNAAAAARSNSSKTAPLQRQQTRMSHKHVASPTIGAGVGADASLSVHSAVPPAPPLSFRQMHELATSLRTQCLRLYADYLRPNSVYQVNIDSDLARMVRAQIAQVDQWQPTPLTADGQPDYERAAMESAPPQPPPFPLSSLYQQTVLSVFTLMETDSFRRFLLTADFQQLLQRADDQEMERLEKQSFLAAGTEAVLAHAEAALHAHAHEHENGHAGTGTGAGAGAVPSGLGFGVDSDFSLPGTIHTQRSSEEPETARMHAHAHAAPTTGRTLANAAGPRLLV